MFSYAGCGYSLVGEVITITTNLGTTQIELAQASVMLTKDNHWQPLMRLNGLSINGVQIGLFNLRNEKTAEIFRYYGSRKFIVIQTDGKYFILDTADNKALYAKLQGCSDRISNGPGKQL